MIRNKKRKSERSKKRFGCTVSSGETQLTGVVLDISATGLFVQTRASLGPGTEVEVDLHLPGSRRVQLHARVARKKSAPQQMVSIVQGGLGLELIDPPQAYLDFVASVQGRGPAGPQPKAAEVPAVPAPEKAPPSARFRVRLKQLVGPRSMTLEIAAASESEARHEALTSVGLGWKILACTRLS